MAVFLLQNLVSLFLIALLLRVYIQWLGVPVQNPFAQFVFKLTNFIIYPLKRLIPRMANLYLAILLLAMVVQFVLTLVVYELQGFPFAVAGIAVLPGFAALSLADLLTLVSHIVMGLVLTTAILSMVDPFSVLAASFDSLTAPLLRPFRRILPVTGSIDWSPMIVLILCQLIDMFPLAGLARWAHQLI